MSRPAGPQRPKEPAPPRPFSDLLPDDAADNGPDLLAELADEKDAVVMVYKVAPSGVGESYCFTVLPSELNYWQLLDRIAAECGGGIYSIRPRVGSQFKGRKRVEIAAPPPGRRPQFEPERPAPREPSPAAPDASQLMLGMMREQNTFLTSLLTAMIQKQGGGGGGGGGGGMTFDNAIALAGLLKGEQKDPLQVLSGLVEFQKAIGLAPGGDGGDRSGANGNDLWIAAINGLSKIAEKIPAVDPAAPVAVVPRQRPALAPPAAAAAPKPAAAPAAPPRAPDPLAMVRAIVQRLVEAEGKATAEQCADWMLQHVPEDRVLQLLDDDAWWSKLVLVMPAAAAHESWLAEIRTAVLAQFDDETPAGEAGEGAP